MTALPPLASTDSATRIRDLRTQHGPGLLGVPGAGLRLSWRVESDDPHARILGHQLATGADEATLAAGDPVAGDASVGVPVPGRLAPRERRLFSVRVATRAGWTPWSEPIVVEAGVAGPELEASVIGIPSEIDGPVPLLRRQFALDGVPTAARLRLSALGLVDAWINGVRVSDALLTPGWTSYQERILLDTYDVTGLLRAGENVIVLAVADGWYRGSFGFARRTAIYGDRTGALAQLEADGVVIVTTDASWRGGFGAIRSASIYDGTVTDLRRHDPAVHEPGYPEDGWVQASVIGADPRLFEPRSAPPVRVIAELPMTVTPDAAAGRTRLDAGQNISGWVRLVVEGAAGDVVTIRHAEVLEPTGALHLKALRSAKATDVYVLDRDGRHALEPSFTFHGFQYADVEGAEVVSAEAIAISSDLAPRSSFASSHEALNRFHSNVSWSQRDNFVSVPTDCPQRDERLGWTGDAQAFAATACTLVDAEAFWMSWLRDLAIDQTDAGVPSVVPDIIRPHDIVMPDGPIENMGRAGWADAATIVPFAVYEAYGSTDVLVRQLDSMRRWVTHLRERAGEDVVLPTSFQYGDWLDPDAPGDRPWLAKVSSDFVANAFYAHSARLLARAERLVGDRALADEADALADRVAAETFARWGEDAILTQTGAALSIEFDIAPRERHAEIARGLAENVRRENGRIATGFLGTPLVLFALSRHGHLDEAYLMVLRRDAPSWLYQVDRGATTVWERWDAIRPDGSIHSGDLESSPTVDGDGPEAAGMLSFNHYAYGAMVDWLYRTVAGLAPDLDEPGYRLVHVAPRPAVGLDRAEASIDTRYGRLAIQWQLAGDVFEATLDVPFGARAVLDLPVTDASSVTVDDDAPPAELTHGRHRIVVTAPAVARAGSAVPA